MSQSGAPLKAALDETAEHWEDFDELYQLLPLREVEYYLTSKPSAVKAEGGAPDVGPACT